MSSGPSNWWIILITGGQLIVAFLQWRTYRRQAQIMETQAGISRQGIAAQRRPKFLIREMILSELTDEQLRITSVLANAGDARGAVIGSFVEIQSVIPQQWRPQEAPPDANVMGNFALESGEQRRWTFGSAVGPGTAINLANAQAVQQAHGGQDPGLMLGVACYLRGFVVYEDEHGIRRRTAFFRRLNVGTWRFYSLGPEATDYEYAD